MKKRITPEPQLSTLTTCFFSPTLMSLIGLIQITSKGQWALCNLYLERNRQLVENLLGSGLSNAFDIILNALIEKG
ncbi:hypothetical protein OB13_20525 [Pontibacter sp. HJ8]